MQITSKGQVTIPKEIRDEFGLLPHTEIEFKVKNQQIYLIKLEKKSKRSKTLIEKMRGKGTVKMTTDQIMALTRGE